MSSIPNGGTSDLGKLPKDLKRIVKKARDAGWTVTRCRGSAHLRFKPPAGSTRPRDGRTTDHEDHYRGRTLTHGTSDSDVNGIRVLCGDLRREGLEVYP